MKCFLLRMAPVCAIDTCGSGSSRDCNEYSNAARNARQSSMNTNGHGSTKLPHSPTLLSVFGVKPLRIGGTETFARELSMQLAERGWQSVLCFLSEPTAEVRRFLDLPNISFEVLENSTDGNREARRNLAQI